mmetsp:Transcript_17955/g.29967  ORF Transcript_17955/g.29967 Transcript_17955/m.29967 type:complete len:534 (-) Transcript_17955:133-1734(-)
MRSSAQSYPNRMRLFVLAAAADEPASCINCLAAFSLTENSVHATPDLDRTMLETFTAATAAAAAAEPASRRTNLNSSLRTVVMAANVNTTVKTLNGTTLKFNTTSLKSLGVLGKKTSKTLKEQSEELQVNSHVSKSFKSRSKKSGTGTGGGIISDSSKLTTAVALDGGDMWAGARVDEEELRALADDALSKRIAKPVMAQWHLGRRWMWAQWVGTIVRVVLPREVFANTIIAVGMVALVHCVPAIAPHFRGVERVWLLCSGLISFSLSFFLQQAYALWRNVYLGSRKVQRRLNDILLLCAAAAAHAGNDEGGFTNESDEMLRTLARYVRLYNVLLYASLTSRFAPLGTPNGFKVLVQLGALKKREQQVLLESSQPHQTVLTWLSQCHRAGLADGRLDPGYERVLQTSLIELRRTAASISDELSGRMPLAYTHLMQLLCDVLVLFTPVALLSTVGGFSSAVVGTAVVTLFYSSVLKLAKMFCDPYDNELYGGSKYGIAINIDCLLQETNSASERWRRGAVWIPEIARRTRSSVE